MSATVDTQALVDVVARRLREAGLGHAVASRRRGVSASGVGSRERRREAHRHVEADETERRHLAAGLLTERDVVDSRQVRLEVARLSVSGLAARVERAQEAQEAAMEAVADAERRLEAFARRERERTVQAAVERLADPAPLPSGEREVLERRLVAARAAKDHGVSDVVPLAGDAAARGDRAAEHLRDATQQAEIAREAASRVLEQTQSAERRLDAFAGPGLGSDELAGLEEQLAGDRRAAAQAVDAVVAAAEEALGHVGRAVREVDGESNEEA